MTGPLPLEWPNCLNVRDLGGLPTEDGRRIAAGALIRSDNHTRLTAEGVALVRAAVNRIVDVRTPAECAGDPSPFAADSRYLNLPVALDGDPYDPAMPVAQSYAVLLDRHPDLLAAAVGGVADAPPGGVAVHCHAGKDRSGIVVALTLRIAGVREEAVAADYSVVHDGLKAVFAEDLAAVEDPVARAHLAVSFVASPQTMLDVFAHLDRCHGGVEGYLRTGGLTSTQVAAIRDRLRDDRG